MPPIAALMPLTRRVLLAAVGCSAVALAVVVLVQRRGEERPPVPEKDLLQHPVYSQYRFATEENVIRIGVQPFWPFEANLVEAMRRDLILRESLAHLGMQIEFHAFLKGPDIEFFIHRGQLDAGVCGYLPTVRSASSGRIAVVALVDRGFNELVARGCISVANLKGKRVGVPIGSDAHHMLCEALEGVGLREDQVRIPPMDVDAMPEAFDEGRVDACAAWPPATQQILALADDARLIHRSMWLGFLFFRREFAERHPEAVRLVLAAHARAFRWVSSHRRNMETSSEWAVEACRRLAPDAPVPSVNEFAGLARQVLDLSPAPVISADDLSDEGFLHRAFTFLERRGDCSAGALWDTTRAAFELAYMNEILHHRERYQLDVFRYESRAAMGGEHGE